MLVKKTLVLSLLLIGIGYISGTLSFAGQDKPTTTENPMPEEPNTRKPASKSMLLPPPSAEHEAAVAPPKYPAKVKVRKGLVSTGSMK